ncbi:MAG: hypothetical protein ACK4WD_00570 [Flavobacteriales bacterium]|jgi:hypothetical protein
MRNFFSIGFLLLFSLLNSDFKGQSTYDFGVDLVAKSIPSLPGLHSYAFAQSEGKWLIVGGRRDGLHARQPFNAFPANQNNTMLMLIDPIGNQFWEASLLSLPLSVQEQLQSTNMNFEQSGDTLVLIGGYAYSESEGDHITFPYLTTIIVSEVINGIINDVDFSSSVKQVYDESFAVCGGQLAALGNKFYLAGGHRFDGRYNPMGNPTYTQQYTNEIKIFELDNTGDVPVVFNQASWIDEVHLHRRDYNLLPLINSEGDESFMISSGVFQTDVNLPFLYPVMFDENGYSSEVEFMQYLSNYHCAHAAFYDELNQKMHTMYFGGISRYYMNNGQLIEDSNVPFIQTISAITFDNANQMQEVELQTSMPDVRTASAEFIPSPNLESSDNGVLFLPNDLGDGLMIGHIYGGIYSPTANPFSVNQTNTTSASSVIYEVWLNRSDVVNVELVDHPNLFAVEWASFTPEGAIHYKLNAPSDAYVRILLSDVSGKLVAKAEQQIEGGNHSYQSFFTGVLLPTGLYHIHFSFDGKFFQSINVIKP